MGNQETASPPSGTTGSKPLLLDLSRIDLSSRVIGRDLIGRQCAHRGQMALVDYVVWHSDNFKEGVGLKHNRPDEFWVEGHFPGRPMLPGVVMVEAAAQVGVFLYNSRFPKPKLAAFTHIRECTFRNSVTVGDDLYLLCKEVKFTPRRFISQVQGVVNGKPAFEAEVSGIVLG